MPTIYRNFFSLCSVDQRHYFTSLEEEAIPALQVFDNQGRVCLVCAHDAILFILFTGLLRIVSLEQDHILPLQISI